MKLSNVIWGTGFALVAVGEIMGAVSDDSNDTISEFFDGQPRITQFAIIFFCGAVFAHFARWMIGSDALKNALPLVDSQPPDGAV